MPEVSVIVPNYNHSGFLPKRIESILDQTFQDFEIILLDDCSTDGSVGILEKYAQNKKVTVFLKNLQNSGSTFSQLKKGALAASGKYLWIAESDDWADKYFLEKTFKEMSPSTGIVYTQSYIINDHNEIQYLNTKHTDNIDPDKWRSGFHEKGTTVINSYFISRNIIPNMSAALIRKADFLEAVENVRLKYLGDWLIYCKILLKKDLAYISEPLNYYRQHSGTVRSRALYNGLREMEYFQLLDFFKKQNVVQKGRINKQFCENTKLWIHKAHEIKFSMHLRIACQFVKYLL